MQPFLFKHGLILIRAWISNNINWGEITYPFLNFNGVISYPYLNLNCVAVEFYEWISNFTQHFTGHVITYPCSDSK